MLERLNSVLEPSRTLTLAEKGGEGAEVVVAQEGFRWGGAAGAADEARGVCVVCVSTVVAYVYMHMMVPLGLWQQHAMEQASMYWHKLRHCMWPHTHMPSPDIH